MPTYPLKTLKDTKALADQLAKNLKAPAWVLLKGDLGAGKTTFTQFFIQTFSQKPLSIKSPTYALVQTYELGIRIHHFDLYRLHESPNKALMEDLLELLWDERAISIVEWPTQELLEQQPPWPRICLEFESNPHSEERRVLCVGSDRCET